jgi:hypothetical protein
MRTKIFVALCAVLFVAGTVFAGGDDNKAEKRAFNYVATFVEPIDAGAVTYSGKMAHLRGVMNRWFHDASDERIKGTLITVMNANVDFTGTGVTWGTWQSSDDGDGGWEGTFTGKMYDLFLGESNWIIKYAGHGTGAYEGLKIEGIEAWDTLGYGVGEITSVTKD